MKSAGGPHGILRFQEGKFMGLSQSRFHSCQVFCNGKLLWGPQRTAVEARGGQRINIKQCAPFLDRTNGRVRKMRKHGEESQKGRKETPFFKLMVSPKFASQLPSQHGFWNHFHHHEGTPALGFVQKSAPFLPHASYPDCAHNKKWDLCRLKRGLVWRLGS